MQQALGAEMRKGHPSTAAVPRPKLNSYVTLKNERVTVHLACWHAHALVTAASLMGRRNMNSVDRGAARSPGRAGHPGETLYESHPTRGCEYACGRTYQRCTSSPPPGATQRKSVWTGRLASPLASWPAPLQGDPLSWENQPGHLSWWPALILTKPQIKTDKQGTRESRASITQAS